MSLLSGLLSDAQQLKATLIEVLNLQQLNMEKMNAMSQKGDELKTLIGEIGTDISEIDGDMDEVLAKVNEITGLPTAQEWDDIKTSLTAMKGNTSTLAAKVPEPPPTPQP